MSVNAFASITRPVAVIAKHTSRIRASQMLILNDASNIGTGIIGASIQGTTIIECFQRAVAEVE